MSNTKDKAARSTIKFAATVIEDLESKVKSQDEVIKEITKDRDSLRGYIEDLEFEFEKMKDEIVRIALGTNDTFTHRDLIALVPDRKECNHNWQLAYDDLGEPYEYCKKCKAET